MFTKLALDDIYSETSRWTLTLGDGGDLGGVPEA